MAQTIASPPVILCSVCSEPVDTFSFSAGRIVTQPYGGPTGGPGHLMLTGDDPDPQSNWGYGDEVRPWKDGNVYRVEPCGHRVTEAFYVDALRSAAEWKAERCRSGADRHDLTYTYGDENLPIATSCRQCGQSWTVSTA